MVLPVARYHFCAEVQKPLQLPFYAGSMLRGAFGQALRRLACMTRQSQCIACPLTATCPYSLLFEASKIPHAQTTPVIPNPYVIEPPPAGSQHLAAGQELRFSMVLIGQAIPQLPLVILAWQQALQRGLGKGQACCQLQAVYCEQDPEPVFVQGQTSIRSHSPIYLAPPPPAKELTLVLQTPLRLQHQGARVGRRELTAPLLLTALLRRIQALYQQHLPDSPHAELATLFQHTAQIQISHNEGLRWLDWTRYSSRQQQNMTLGGLVGELHLRGALEPFISALHLGQWLHLGKNATFGMGRYRLCIDTES